MEFMDIGPLELLIVLLIGFLIFGPEKLPKMAATAGRWWHRFKKASFDFSKTIAEEIEVDKAKEERAISESTLDKKEK